MDAEPGMWPWMASIQLNNEKEHACGGVLITNQHVLTATHCVKEYVMNFSINLIDTRQNRKYASQVPTLIVQCLILSVSLQVENWRLECEAWRARFGTRK